MRLDGKVTVMIGKLIREVCAQKGAAFVRTGQDAAAGLSRFLQ